MFDTENWFFHKKANDYGEQISPISREDRIFQEEKKMSVFFLYCYGNHQNIHMQYIF